MGDERLDESSPSTLIYARPFAPNSLTKSVYRSIWPLPTFSPSGTTSAAILELSSFAGSENTLNSSCLKISDNSTSFSGFLKSVLSQPYFSIA